VRSDLDPLGRALIDLRRGLDLSQHVVARAMHVSIAMISLLEGGLRRSPKLLRRLLAFYARQYGRLSAEQLEMRLAQQAERTDATPTVLALRHSLDPQARERAS